MLRLSLATSILFALLTGAAATAPAAEPVPAAPSTAIAAPAVEASEDTPPVLVESPALATSPPVAAAEAVPLPATGAPVAVAHLHGRSGGAVAGPRAPPAAA
ncbi:hypothetical protein GCM10010166_42880 [Couchioplanes caeruleus subsp. azureus]|nr:hypothetical protein GCM10010166_42880 [Couchioplanes caeruleus subsp. azureus]